MIAPMDTPETPATLSQEELYTFVGYLAQQLGETEKEPMRVLRRIVRLLGKDQALAFLQKTQETEAQGGMMLPDGSRRRTPGGVFFYLVRSGLPKDKRHLTWATKTKSQPGTPKQSAAPAAQQQPQAQTTPPAPAFQWADRLALIKDLLPQLGVATTVKITLIGRPTQVIERGEVVLLGLQSGKAPSLPKGVPAPAETPTTYVVYVARKQWAKVAEEIKNPEDVLIIEGYPAYDPQLKAMGVHTTNISTKLQQAAKRQGQSAQSA